jgi:hypothetical protein
MHINYLGFYIYETCTFTKYLFIQLFLHITMESLIFTLCFGLQSNTTLNILLLHYCIPSHWEILQLTSMSDNSPALVVFLSTFLLLW